MKTLNYTDARQNLTSIMNETKKVISDFIVVFKIIVFSKY